MKLMKKSWMAFATKRGTYAFLLVSALIFSGCTHDNKAADSYKVNGILQHIEKSGAVTDGLKSEYQLQIANVEPVGEERSQAGGELIVSITKNTILLNEQQDNIEAASLQPGSLVQATWRFANDHLTEATEIIILDEDPSMDALAVDQIQQIAITEPSNLSDSTQTKQLAALHNKHEFQAFADAVKDTTIVTGPIIAIGANYDFVIEYASIKHRYSYWNGPHLKMIADYETKKYYYLSEASVKVIDSLIDGAGAE